MDPSLIPVAKSFRRERAKGLELSSMGPAVTQGLLAGDALLVRPGSLLKPSFNADRTCVAFVQLVTIHSDRGAIPLVITLALLLHRNSSF